MKSINELVGIIRGISFDGVINQKEVHRLQKWVNQNRSMIYDNKQLELISLVDKVLEDQIISQEERRTLIEYCNKRMVTSEEFSMLLELNGIIEGIVCDGVINYSEVSSLREWMAQNSASLNGFKGVTSIRKCIDDVLADGIITEDEHSRLLVLLMDRLKEVQFQSKLDHLILKVKSRANIGNELVDLFDDESAISLIHEKAQGKLKAILDNRSGINIKDHEYIFLSLVLIAMVFYDGNYYDYVRDTYEDLYDNYSSQKIEGVIRTLIFNHYTDEADKNSGMRKINTILENAIVPVKFLKSFFDFIFDIYKINFEYNLSDDLEEDFKFVYEGLRSSINTTNDELKLNVTKKSYKLIQTTKHLITKGGDYEEMIRFSSVIVKLIDNKVWGREQELFNQYLKQGYDAWTATLVLDKQSNREKNSSELRSRWEPKFELSNNSIQLVPPVHRVKAQYDYHQIRVVVKNGDVIIYNFDRPVIKEIIGGYEVTVEKMKLDKPLGELQYLLLAGDEKIYDSKDKLKRSLILFNDKGSEIPNNCDHSGAVVFCVDPKLDVANPFLKEKDFQLYSKNIILGETEIVGDEIVNFSSIIKAGVIGEAYKNHYLQQENSQPLIQVYKGVDYLVFETQQLNAQVQVEINGVLYKAEDLIFESIIRSNFYRYKICLKNMGDGIHKIVVYLVANGARDKILDTIFAVDSDLHTHVSKIADTEYNVLVVSSFIHCMPIKKIGAVDFNLDWLKFNYNGSIYTYYIPLELAYYCIDDTKWRSNNEEIWIDNITPNSTLTYFGGEIDEIKVLSDKGIQIDQEIPFRKEGVIQQLQIGFLLSYKSTCDYVVLLFLRDGKCDNAVYCYNKCMLDKKKTETSVDLNDGKLTIKPVYYGVGNISLKVKNAKGEIIRNKDGLNNNTQYQIENLKSFSRYSLHFFENGKGLLKKEREIGTFHVNIYRLSDFVNHEFRVKEAFYDDFYYDKALSKSMNFSTTYLRITNMISNSRFEGEIFSRGRKGVFWHYKINPIEVEVCGDITNSTIEMSLTKDGDGLLLDEYRKGVLNQLEDPKAKDIISYSIELKEE